WAVSGPLHEREGGVPLTDMLPNRAMLPRFDPQTDFHAGLFIALVCAVLTFYLLHRTRLGFNIRVVGENFRVARSNLISVDLTRICAMLASGALCGLAGGIEYVGVSGQIGTGFSQNWGFLGIPVALVSM